MTATKEKSWTFLRHDDMQDVYIIAKDDDKFILPLDEAIAACKSYEEAKKFLPQFNDLLDRIDVWLRQHEKDIDGAYVAIGNEGGVVDLAVVLRSTMFDQTLQESLVELDLEIAQADQFDLINLRVMPLPLCSPETLKSFIHPRFTWIHKQERP